MRGLTLALALLALAISTAEGAPRRAKAKQVRQAPPQSIEALTRHCQYKARFIQGRAWDVHEATFIDECVRRGGRI